MNRALMRLRPLWLWHLCVIGTIVVVAPALPWSGVVSVIELIVSTTAVFGLVVGIRLNRPRHRTGWHVLLAAVVYTVVSNVAWPVLQAAGVMGYAPSVDLLYFTTYPVLGLALLILPLQGRKLPWSAGLTEAAIITSGAAVVWWIFLIDPLIFDNRLPDHVHLHVIAYPMLDMAIFALGMRLLLIGGTTSVSFVLIAMTTVCLMVADTANFVVGVHHPGADPPTLSTLGWLLANALLGAAGLHPSMARVPEPGDAATAERFSGAGLYIATVVATPGLSLLYLIRELWMHTLDTPDIVVPLSAATVTATLVVVRMRQFNTLARQRAAALQHALDSEAALQAELRHLAEHDPLTGLPNRAPLYDRITRHLAAEQPAALLVLDVDNFKDVNDRFGHAAGDELLVAVAARLGQLSGAEDLLARLDSDEFALVAAATGAAERAADMVTAMRRPFLIQGSEVFASVSAGLRRIDDELLTGDVLRDAYMSLHAAKAGGRDQVVEFRPELSDRTLARARTVERLRGALGRGELLLHYQPLVRLADERLTGVEALIRWQPPGERMIAPDAFIPAAEDSGLIVPIGAWVLREACRTVASWHRRTGAVVSVNVSPRQLREPDFAMQALDALRSSELPPSALILEITEGVLVASGQGTEQAIGHLTLLREAGVRVAIDDFGTGYSSLAYLRDLPIDHIKIDKSFMPVDEDDTASRTLVKAVIDLAAGLRLSTTAEGVETAQQVAMLRTLGCERAQGYFFSRPVPAAQAEDLLTASGQRPARV